MLLGVCDPLHEPLDRRVPARVHVHVLSNSGTPPGEPSRNATIGAAVPVEILAGLTDALASRGPAHAPDVLGQLTSRGWAHGKGKHPTAGHPDGTAHLQYRSRPSATD